MTRGALETPRQAKRAAVDLARATTLSPTRILHGFVVSVVIASGLMALGLRTPAQAANAPVEGLTIQQVLIEGNTSVETDKVRAVIKTRPGRPLDRALIDADLRRIHDLKFFAKEDYSVAKSPDGKGVILTFRVEEMPVLNSVTFRGRSAVKLKDIEEATGLKKGARADAVHTRLAEQQIKQLYLDKGYEKAEVKLIKGGKSEDRDVIFEIFEGPKYKVGDIGFIGNEWASDAILRAKLASRKPLFGINLLGHYEKEGFNEDAEKITEYYQQNGFLEARVKPVVRSGEDLGKRNVTFVIDEGKRYKVRKVILEGNKIFKTDELMTGLRLHSGQFWSESIKTADFEFLRDKYFSRGHIDARVDPGWKVTPEPNVVDLVYKIDEGPQFRLGELVIKGNHRTLDKVARRHANYAALLPGELLDSKKVDNFKQRLSMTGYFQMNPQKGQVVNVQIVNKRTADRPFGDTALDMNSVNLTRFQSPEEPTPPPLDAPPPIEVSPGGSASGSPFGSDASSRFSPAPDTMPSNDLPVFDPKLAPPRRGGRGVDKFRGLPNGPGGSEFDRSNPSGAGPTYPAGNANSNIVDRQEPFTANQAYADVIASVEEAPTASFVLGAGASSFGGLYGNLSLTENNFNLLAIPRSWDDFRQGRAFRGAGQQLSLELMPGTLINYYSLRFFDPAIFDLDLGFSLQGYQLSRFYYDWKELRSGGKMAFAHRIGTQAVAELGVRAEDVDISGFRYPAPALLLAASGHSTLISLRPSFKIDTRDNPFLTSSGRFMELAYEQGFGTFNFGKLTAEARQYFTTGSRPDGSGKRVLTIRGFFGAASLDTPIYERFFAGNLNSLRGFQYRGIGAFDLNVNTGGIYSSLASIEYRFPWNARDTFYQVVFLDSGTVENTYSITNYRVSVGTGLRILIPQVFKQAPLAFDLAFPLSKGPEDRMQAFNFSIGGSW